MGVVTTPIPSLTTVLSAARSSGRRRSFPYRQHHYRLHSLPNSSLVSSSVFVQRKKYSRRSLTSNSACKIYSCLVEVRDETDDEACELVSGSEVTIGEDGDRIQAYLFKAMKNNNGTGILLLSDIFGFQDSSTRDFAYRVACNGYNVLVPDLFRGDPWANNKPVTMLDEWLATQDPKRVAKDIDLSTKWLVDEFIAAGISKKLGIIGFCYGGGRVIEVLARDQGVTFGVGVSFYGTRMDPSLASSVKVPILFIAGADDPLCPVNVLKDFENEIGTDSKVVVFDGRGHGFVHRPKNAEEDSDAEKAFTVMRAWLYRDLIANS